MFEKNGSNNNELETDRYVTDAYKRYWETERRVFFLLLAGTKGLEQTKIVIDDLIRKLDNPPTNIAESHEEKFQVTYDEKGEPLISMRLTEREGSYVKNNMEKMHEMHLELDQYFYSVLLVYCWGAFETYIYAVFRAFQEATFDAKK